MTPLERKARDLRDVIQDIMHQFRVVDGAFAHGPARRAEPARAARGGTPGR
jgi:hypothetical protein